MEREETMDGLLTFLASKGGEWEFSRVPTVAELEAIEMGLIEEIPRGIWDTSLRLTDKGRTLRGMAPRSRPILERLAARILVR